MLKIKYFTQVEKQPIIDKYIEQGYRLLEEHNHTDGNSLLFGPPSDYHMLIDDNWEFDRDAWLDTEVRPTRNQLLKDTDYIMVYDVQRSLSYQNLSEWMEYRQKLRDLPTTIGEVIEPVKINWPVQPAVQPRDS